MNIYFARSILGNHSENDEAVNQTIIDAIKRCDHVPALELPKLASGVFHNTKEYIHRRDLNWIDQCQALVAEVSNPSLGVGYEIAYAMYSRKIPVLAVARKGAKVSAMIAGANYQGLEMRYYEDTVDLDLAVEIFLRDVDGDEPIAADLDPGMDEHDLHNE